MPKERVGVVGVGQTKHEATRGDVSMAGLVREAASRALADAEMTWSDIDAVVVNAAGGSLDMASIETIAANARLRVVCGSENLAMPAERAGSGVLRVARKAYAPTELGGMMGYLTAAEEYLARIAGTPFDIESLIESAAQLEPPIVAAMQHLRAHAYSTTFAESLIAVCEGN